MCVMSCFYKIIASGSILSPANQRARYVGYFIKITPFFFVHFVCFRKCYLAIKLLNTQSEQQQQRDNNLRLADL